MVCNISENKNNFIALIRKKATKSPTENGFDQELWLKTWINSSDNQDADKALYDAGIIFDILLTELRRKISELYKTPPNVTASELLRSYCGLANRDRAIIDKTDVEHGIDITSITTSKNKFKNKLNFQEIADGSVDGIQYAVRSTLKKSSKMKLGETQMDAFLFIQKELEISQLYGTFEDYWRALLWGEYQFIEVDKESNIYEVREIASDLTISYKVSQIRKMKIYANSIETASNTSFLDLLKNKNYLFLNKSGNKNKLLVKTVDQLDQIDQIRNAVFEIQTLYLSNDFPKSFLDLNCKSLGFDIFDVVEVFRILSILSHISLSNFPEDDSVFSVENAIEFSPKIDRQELVKGISKATGFKLDKCSKIISFLSFNGEQSEDLWCHPIINLGGNEVTYLVAALVTPIMQRVVEHWLTKLKIDLADKGETYEHTVLNNINSELDKNPTFQDYNKASSRKFKLGKNRDEEIDLILRIGRIIIIGEVKSIVTTDSPISFHRTKETIIGAAEQAKRKKQFVSENVEEVFKNLGWNYNKKLDYEFLPLVITSNSIGVGHTVDGVPVCDLRIVLKYFSSNIVPLVTVGFDNHIAWFEIYKDFNEAQSNISKYINKPPQIAMTRDDFDFDTCCLPIDIENLPTIQFTRLIKKQTNPSELVRRDYSFPVSLSPNFDEFVSKADFII